MYMQGQMCPSYSSVFSDTHLCPVLYTGRKTMGIRDAIKKFSDEIQDLSTLTVTTYTGTLSQVIDSDSGEIDWDKFKPSSGELTMVAATRISADYDTVNFRAALAGIDNLDDLLQLHRMAVETAQNGRAGLVKLLTGTVSGIF